MTQTSPVPATTTCPLCHTRSLTADALTAEESWQCQRCSQLWTGRRVANVEAYAAWCAATAAVQS
jgi:ribosomal protein L37AE/L43A